MTPRDETVAPLIASTFPPSPFTLKGSLMDWPLNWLVNFHGLTVVAIPGATRQEQATQNAAAMNLDLSRPELDEIDKLSRDFLDNKEW